jgi:hypothetical protein
VREWEWETGGRGEKERERWSEREGRKREGRKRQRRKRERKKERERYYEEWERETLTWLKLQNTNLSSGTPYCDLVGILIPIESGTI